MNEEYANYDYQTVTVPLKTEYGVTIGAETKSTYKLCTKDCKYQHNWNELKKWLIEQEERAWDEVSSTFGYVLDKLEELEGVSNE